jgi:CDP-diacylglycerol--glycerol-3-phosphate 3-phosphatidyltransferase
LHWVPGIVYLGISLADLIDGLVARRQRRETELGKQLDITTDAAGILVAALLGVSLGRLPGVYLLVGTAYYVFIFGIWWRRKRGLPVVALPPRPYARIIAGFQMGLAGVALLPIFDPTFTFIAAYIFMTPLLAGFLRDWQVVSCRVKTDAPPLTAAKRGVSDLLLKRFPLLLRLIVLFCGIAVLAATGMQAGDPALSPAVSRTGYLAGDLTIGICSLLIATAVMGRSAALLLVLLLGSNLLPLEMSAPVTILFGAAATLTLTGTGNLSLWAPEEGLLYRCGRRSQAVCGKAP